MNKKYIEGTKIQDLIGMKFGKLTVVDFDGERYKIDKIRRAKGEIKGLFAYWICKCECGKEISVGGGDLKSIKTTSCGLCYTFEDWCLDNNRQDYLDSWDYELNDKKPSEVASRSSKKYYFKCPRGLHESEEFKISGLTSLLKTGNYNTTLYCRKCNSFGEYLLDTYGDLNIWADKDSSFDVSRMSGKKYTLRCNDCGEVKDIDLSSFVKQGLSCKCGDSQSYPNKFIYGLLRQIHVDYKHEIMFKWAKHKRYDIYIASSNVIIENHGLQHYVGWGHNHKDMLKQQVNDKLKKDLAIKNGVKHYIELDCRKSKMEWIKKSIMDSELPELLGFDEGDIDWIECDKFATKNLLKEVCDLWMSGAYTHTKDICKDIKLSPSAVVKYLKKGSELGWCDYKPREEISKRHAEACKVVGVFKNNKMIHKCCSIVELDSISEKIFGVKFNKNSISKACNGKIEQYKGYTFKFL